MSSEGGNIKSFRGLMAWQKAMTLVEMVYAMTAQLPAEERYGLTSQMRRAAVSVPSNIAEGHARDSSKEFGRYISIARGSLAEVQKQLELAARLGFSEPDRLRSVLEACDELGRILRGLRRSIDKKIAT